MILSSILGLFSNDLAIDLGTANTLVYIKGQGVVANEPSVVAVQDKGKGQKKTLAVGREAYEMVGRTPNSIKAIRPLRDGVIADFETAQKMIEYFIRKTHNNRKSLVRPRIVISVPIGITEVEKRAVRESAEAAGAREVFLIEETVSAALGSGVPVTEPEGRMVVDIGGGTTGIAIIALAEIVVSTSIKVGGDKLNESIVQYVKRNNNMNIGERMAENVKKRVGTAMPAEEGKVAGIKSIKVKGRDIRTGNPSMLELDQNAVREAMIETIGSIIEAIKQTLERTPPELAADILDSGIILAGGGALLSRLDELITVETGVPVIVADNPLQCVVLGSGRALDKIDLLREVSIK